MSLRLAWPDGDSGLSLIRSSADSSVFVVALNRVALDAVVLQRQEGSPAGSRLPHACLGARRESIPNLPIFISSESLFAEASAAKTNFV